MAWSIVQHTQDGASSGTRATTTYTFGAAPTSGNVLLAVVAFNTNGRTMGSASGWTGPSGVTGSVTNQAGLVAYYKVSNGTETTGSFTCSNGFDFVSCDVFEISGIDTTTPLDVAIATSQVGTATTSCVSPSATPATTGGLAFASITSGGLSGLSGGWSFDEQITFGATTAHHTTATTASVAESCTFTASSSTTYSALTIILRPSATSARTAALGVNLALSAQAVSTARLTVNSALTGVVPGTSPTAALGVNLALRAQVITTARLAVNAGLTGIVPGVAVTADVSAAWIANPYTASPTWTSLTGAFEFETHRGRNYERDSPEAGTASVSVWNLDGRYDPTNTSSPYYPNVLPRRPLKLSVTYGATYDLWRGYLERLPQQWAMGGFYVESHLTAVDAFTPVLSATMGPGFEDVVLDDVGATGLYFPMLDATTSGYTNVAITNAANSNPAQPYIIATSGAGVGTTGVSGSLAGRSADYLGRYTFGSGTQTVMLYHGGTFAAVQSTTAVEFFFRVHQADSNGTHAPIAIFADSLYSGWTNCLYLVHSATATSGYKLIVGTKGTNGAPASTIANLGDLTLDATYQLAIIPNSNTSPTNAQIYLNGTLVHSSAWSSWASGAGGFYGLFSANQGAGNTASPTGLVIDLDEVIVTTLTPTKLKTHYALSGLSGAATSTFPEQLTGARINAVLDAINWPAGMRSIDAGTSYMAAAGSVDGRTALDLILEAAASDLGNVFIDGQGRVVFHSRHHRDGATAAVTFGDRPDLGEIPYDGDLTVEFDDQQVINAVTVGQSLGSTPQTAIRGDVTSQSTYGVKSYTVTLPLRDATDCDGMADTLLARWKDPHARVPSVTIDLASKPASIPQILAREIGDVVRFRRRTPGGASIDINCVIEGINVRFAVQPDGPGLVFDVTFQLDPLPSAATY